MPAWWNSLEILSRVNATAQIATGVLLVVTVVGALVTLMLSSRIDALRAAESLQLHERVRAAEAAQQTLAAQLAAAPPAPAEPNAFPHADRSQAAAGAQRAEPLRNERPSRTLTPEQRHEFVAFMKGKPRGRIGILTVKGDSEAHQFAAEIEAMFRQAGLQTDGISQAMFPREIPRGLLLRLRNAKAAPSHAGPLQLALERIGFPAPGVASSQEPANSVTLVIGRNPDT